MSYLYLLSSQLNVSYITEFWNHWSAVGDVHHHTSIKNLFSENKSINMAIKKKDAWKNLPIFFRYTEILSSFLKILWEFFKGHSGVSSDFLANRTLVRSACHELLIHSTLQFSTAKVKWNFWCLKEVIPKTSPWLSLGELLEFISIISALLIIL